MTGTPDPAPLAFVDVETTGLHPYLHDVWEVAAIIRRPGEDDAEHTWQMPPDLARADPFALDVGGYWQRRNPTTDPPSFARRFMDLTAGCHMVGACVSFDAMRLDMLLRQYECMPRWHYHLVDVEALAAGWLAGARRGYDDAADVYGTPAEAMWAGTTTWNAMEGPDPAPPWDSTDLSRAVGIDPDRYERHTALGDARWARDLYDVVMGLRAAADTPGG